MNWYVVDKKYINYLTQFDSHVGYVEYGERLKLHVGILLTIGDFHYYVPISSAKPKHQKMSNNLDFHKLQDESTGFLYAVLNINNMIPVPDNCLTQLKYNQVESFRSFNNEKEKTDYVYLLQKEKALIDTIQNTLQNKAMKLYQNALPSRILLLLQDVVISKYWKKNAVPILIHKHNSGLSKGVVKSSDLDILRHPHYFYKLCCLFNTQYNLQKRCSHPMIFNPHQIIPRIFFPQQIHAAMLHQVIIYGIKSFLFCKNCARFTRSYSHFSIHDFIVDNITVYFYNDTINHSIHLKEHTMFTEDDIRKETSREITFEKGRLLYNTGGVLGTDLEEDFENGFYINGTILGSYGNEYETWIHVDRQTESIDNYACDCPAFFSYEGMCKHCVALALEFLEHKKALKQLESFKGNFPIKYRESTTDMEILNIVENFALRKRLKEQAACGNIELVPELHENYSYHYHDHRYFLTFKIGPADGRQYVLKNMSDLVARIAREEMYSYGKQLSFVHSKSIFTEKSWEYVKMMERAEESMSYAYQSLGKDLPLTPDLWDTFCEINKKFS